MLVIYIVYLLISILIVCPGGSCGSKNGEHPIESTVGAARSRQCLAPGRLHNRWTIVTPWRNTAPSFHARRRYVTGRHRRANVFNFYKPTTAFQPTD